MVCCGGRRAGPMIQLVDLDLWQPQAIDPVTRPLMANAAVLGLLVAGPAPTGQFPWFRQQGVPCRLGRH